MEFLARPSLGNERFCLSALSSVIVSRSEGTAENLDCAKFVAVSWDQRETVLLKLWTPKTKQ